LDELGIRERKQHQMQPASSHSTHVSHAHLSILVYKRHQSSKKDSCRFLRPLWKAQLRPRAAGIVFLLLGSMASGAKSPDRQCNPGLRRSRGTSKSGALKVWLTERSACSVPFDRNDFSGQTSVAFHRLLWRAMFPLIFNHATTELNNAVDQYRWWLAHTLYATKQKQTP